MARSPAHRFGQIIGDLVEEAVGPPLQRLANAHGLYLDRQGPRPARGSSKLVRWEDSFGNQHNLDYVLERGGTPEAVGVPVAFIESAYRSYTKHSRNKAQEIQGAILPLVTRHSHVAPFAGVVVAGVFTGDALKQLESVGFSVLHLPPETVVAAFSAVGVDASFGEQTPDSGVAAKVAACERLSPAARGRVAAALLEANRRGLDRFLVALEQAIRRSVESVWVLPLHGIQVHCPSVAEAIALVETYAEGGIATGAVVRWEVRVRFSNGDRVEAQFADRPAVLEFLRGYAPPEVRPAGSGRSRAARTHSRRRQP